MFIKNPELYRRGKKTEAKQEFIKMEIRNTAFMQNVFLNFWTHLLQTRLPRCGAPLESQIQN